MGAEKEIIRAAKAGRVEAVRALLAAEPGLIHARDSDGSTPLHCAAWKGHAEVVTLLLDAGADVRAENANDHWGTTPLHAAAHANQAAIAELLIGRGADIRAKDRQGRTPLEHAAFHNARAAARVLAEHAAG